MPDQPIDRDRRPTEAEAAAAAAALMDRLQPEHPPLIEHLAVLTIAWPDGAKATQVFPAGTPVAHATTMIGALADAMDRSRHRDATWSVTPRPT